LKRLQVRDQQFSLLKKDPRGSFLVYDQLDFSRKKNAKKEGKRLKKPKIKSISINVGI
jgi:hypothetical protein